MKEEIERAVEVLRRGGIILYPTDTVWGIGCDATDVYCKSVIELFFQEHKSITFSIKRQKNGLLLQMQNPKA